MADPGKKVQAEDWLRRFYIGAWNVLFENSVIGTLSSDGRQVYAVEDLPLPPPTIQIQSLQEGTPRYFGPLRDAVYHNRLRALDLATGKVVWELGSHGKSGELDPPLAPRRLGGL